MIWFDLVTPKSVLFFEPIISFLQSQDYPFVITSREDEHYTEVNALLKLKKLPFHSFGGYGGELLSQKLEASLKRQEALSHFIQNYSIKKLVNLCSVDGCRVAFGLGIEIVNFCDFPSAKDDKLTHVARLTLPLSQKIFYPFYIPKTYFERYCDDIIEYDFLDPVIYLQNQKPKKDFFNTLPLNKKHQTVCLREEEFKSSYVLHNYMPFVYEVLKKFDVNLIILPRYENDALRTIFPQAIILKEKRELCEILPFCDLFVGGGGTINIEAAYWNTPTISTRSFLSFYDRYLINNGAMYHADESFKLESLIVKLLKQPKTINTMQREVNVGHLIEGIMA